MYYIYELNAIYDQRNRILTLLIKIIQICFLPHMLHRFSLTRNVINFIETILSINFHHFLLLNTYLAFPVSDSMLACYY